MRLTRRDALAALAAAGVAGAAVGGEAALSAVDDLGRGAAGTHGADDAALPDRHVETLVAAAVVLYPSEVEETEGFVRRYVGGRAADRPDVGAGMAAAASYLDDYAGAWFDAGFAALSPPTRDEALRRMNADTASPDPAGSDVERVRFFVVNELLFALFASPTGGRLVGLENPQGHPGGRTSYRRGPDS